MPRIIVELLELEDAVGSLKDFQTKVGKVPEHEELDWSIDGFFPHAQGYEHTLSDGVITNLRLNGRQDGFHLEWCLANRDIEIPEEFDIEKAQDRLFDAFKWHPILLECSVFCSRSHVLHLKRSHALHPPEPRASTPSGATCFTPQRSHVLHHLSTLLPIWTFGGSKVEPSKICFDRRRTE